MKLSTLHGELREIVQQKGRPSCVFISTYSLNPIKLLRTLQYANIYNADGAGDFEDELPPEPDVYCFFQRYSFRTHIGVGGRVVGAKRDEKIESFNSRQRFKIFRIRSTRPPRNQLHLKTAILYYHESADKHIQFVQFSRNIDTRKFDDRILDPDPREIIYSGQPQNLDKLIQLFKNILNKWDRNGGDENPYVDSTNLYQNKTPAMDWLDKMLAAYAGRRNLDDDRAYMLVQGFNETFDQFHTIGQGFNEVLRTVSRPPLPANGQMAYQEWTRAVKESTLLLHFPYVNEYVRRNRKTPFPYVDEYVRRNRKTPVGFRRGMANDRRPPCVRCRHFPAQFPA